MPLAVVAEVETQMRTGEVPSEVTVAKEPHPYCQPQAPPIVVLVVAVAGIVPLSAVPLVARVLSS